VAWLAAARVVAFPSTALLPYRYRFGILDMFMRRRAEA